MHKIKLKDGMIDCYIKELNVRFIVESDEKATLIAMALGYYKEKLQRKENLWKLYWYFL